MTNLLPIIPIISLLTNPAPFKVVMPTRDIRIETRLVIQRTVVVVTNGIYRVMMTNDVVVSQVLRKQVRTEIWTDAPLLLEDLEIHPPPLPFSPGSVNRP